MKKLYLLLFSFLYFTFLHAQQPTLVWAKSMGGVSKDLGQSIVVDASGNVYTTGLFQGTADFDPGAGTANLTTAGGADIFISKLDASGNFVWAKNIGGASDDYGESIAVDAVGNVYTTGSFQGTVDFDPGAGTANLTTAGGADIFISKLDASGNFVWAKNIGGASDDYGESITVDAVGNVYTTGSFQGTVDFDPGAGTTNLTSAGNIDIFISKLDASGNFVWAKSMGGDSGDLGFSIAVDVSGNVYTTGYYMGTADFDPGIGTANLTGAGSTDIFISKLDASGNFVWAKNMGGVSSDAGNSIVIDGSGNVYSTGSFKVTADFDPGVGISNLTSAGVDDIFISKLDASGNFVWAKNMGGSADDQGLSIAVDAAGNVYTTGLFYATADFDPSAGIANLTTEGSADLFISKLDVSGNFVWAKNMGGVSEDQGRSIAVDASGNVHITGLFQGRANFDPNAAAGTANLYSAGDLDIFIVKLTQTIVQPVRLIAFTVNKCGGLVCLNWITANEENVAAYEVERSKDGRSFEKIATEQAKNTTTAQYTSSDQAQLSGVIYYRLKSVDLDGAFTYSKTVAVNMNMATKGLQIIPNPVKEALHLQAMGTETVTLQITDALGKIVKQKKIQLNGSTSFSIDVQSLSKGKYYLVLQSKKGKEVQEFLKQ